MGKKSLTRRTIVDVGMITTKTAWSGSQLIISEWNKEVRLNIGTPNDLAYIREKLTEIESYWRAQLGALR